VYSIRRGYSTANEGLIQEGLEQLGGVEELITKYNTHFTGILLAKYTGAEYHHYYPHPPTELSEEFTATMARIKSLHPHNYPLISNGLVFLDYYFEEILVSQQDMMQREVRTRSLIYLLTHLLTHSLTHSFTHSSTYLCRCCIS
jgi:hypothetical protein